MSFPYLHEYRLDRHCNSLQTAGAKMRPSLYLLPKLGWSDALALIATSPRPVLVDVSGEGCVPCALLHPLVAWVAMEATVEVSIVELDENNRSGWPYPIDRVPALLFFNNGQLLRTEVGFHGLNAFYNFVGELLHLSPERRRTLDDPTIRHAFEDAKAQFDAAMDAAADPVRLDMAAIDPEWNEIQARLQLQEKAGELTATEASRQRITAWRRLSAPFAEKLAAFSKAQASALDGFRARMESAVAAHVQSATDHPQPQNEPPSSCRIGDPSCGPPHDTPTQASA